MLAAKVAIRPVEISSNDLRDDDLSNDAAIDSSGSGKIAPATKVSEEEPKVGQDDEKKIETIEAEPTHQQEDSKKMPKKKMMLSSTMATTMMVMMMISKRTMTKVGKREIRFTRGNGAGDNVPNRSEGDSGATFDPWRY